MNEFLREYNANLKLFGEDHPWPHYETLTEEEIKETHETYPMMSKPKGWIYDNDFVVKKIEGVGEEAREVVLEEAIHKVYGLKKDENPSALNETQLAALNKKSPSRYVTVIFDREAHRLEAYIQILDNGKPKTITKMAKEQAILFNQWEQIDMDVSEGVLLESFRSPAILGNDYIAIKLKNIDTYIRGLK